MSSPPKKGTISVGNTTEPTIDFQGGKVGERSPGGSGSSGSLWPLWLGLGTPGESPFFHPEKKGVPFPGETVRNRNPSKDAVDFRNLEGYH